MYQYRRNRDTDFTVQLHEQVNDIKNYLQKGNL